MTKIKKILFILPYSLFKLVKYFFKWLISLKIIRWFLSTKPGHLLHALLRKVWFWRGISRRNNLAFTVFMIILLGFSGLYVWNAMHPQGSEAVWFHTNWSFRKAVPISAHTSAETNVYLNLTGANDIDTATLISAGKMQSDCGDLRFTDQGGNLLPYYIASGCNSADTVVHVFLQDFPAGDQTFYYYYGNPSASDGFSAADFSTAASGVTFGTLGTEENGPAPVAYWKFDEGTGNVASSSAIFGPKAQLLGPNTPSWQPPNLCISDNCLLFSGGTSGSVQSQSTVSGVQTVSFWVKPASGSAAMVDLNTSDASIIATSGTITAPNFSSPTIYVNGQVGSTLVVGKWNYVTVTTATPITASKIKIGNVKGDYLVGQIDEFSLYNYARSASQIKSNYNLTASVLGASANMPAALSNGLVGYWTEDNLPPGIIQTKSNYQSNVTTMTITFDKPVQATSTIVVVGYGWKSGTNWTPLATEFTDTLSNTYARADWWGGGDPAVTVMYTYNNNDGGANTITIDPTGTTGWNLGFVAYELSAPYQYQDINPLDVTTGTDSVTSTTPSTGSVTPTANNDVSFAVLTTVTGGASITSVTAPSGYTDDLNATSGTQDGDVVSRLFTDTSSTNPTWTASPSQAYSAMVAMFKTPPNISDSSGNINTLVDGGAGGSLYAGKFGDGIDLESTSSQFQYAPDSATLSITGSLTLSAWIKPESTSATQNDILGKWDSSSRESYLLAQRGQKVRLYLDSASNYIETDSNVLTAATWAHVAGVYNQSQGTANIYINGELVPTTVTGTIPSSIGDDTGRFHIGADNSSGTATNFFDGIIDDARVYSRNLSSQDISTLANWGAGPIAQYTFEDNPNGNVVNDNSTYSNNGGFSGSTWPKFVSGKFGNGLNVNAGGNNNYVNVPDTYSLDIVKESLTLEGWVKRNSVGDSNETLYKKDRNYILRYGGTDLNAYYWDTNGNQYQYTITTPLNIGKWYHIAVVIDADAPSNATFYINGVPTVDAAATSATTAIYTNNLSLGGSGSEELDGIMDQFQVYNYARSAKQIISDMNAGHPNVGSPVASPLVYLKLDGGYGNVASNSGSLGELGNAGLVSMADPATANSGWNQNGKYNKALAFDGINDYAYVNGSTGINFGDVSFAVGAWFNTNTTVTDSPIITNYNNSTPYIDLSINSSRQLAWDSRDSNSQTVSVASTVTVNDSKWHHALAVRDTENNVVNLYLDGKLVGTTADTRTGNFIATNNGNRYYLGWDRTVFYPGLIDEAKIYNYALTASEVKLDYNRQAGLVLGALSDTSQLSGGSVASNSAGAEYCVPGDSTSCAAPLARFTFEDGYGTTLSDISGNANTGTWNGAGPYWAAGKYGKGGIFNGSSTYVNAGTQSILNLSSDLTFSTWFNTSKSGASQEMIFKGTNSNNLFDTFISSTGLFNCEIYQNNSLNAYLQAAGTVAVNDGKWHFGSCTLSGTTLTAYVDGVAVGVDNTTTGSRDTTTTQPLYIGKYVSTISTFYFQGSLDEVRIYDYARTPAQVAWDYNKGAPSAYWKMDECQGTTLYDSSGNGNTGTKNGSSTTGTCSTASSFWGGASGTSTTNAGKYNYAPTFDGSSDYVLMPTTTALQGTNGITLSAWVKADGFGGNRSPVGFFGSGSDKGYWLNVQNTGEPQFWISRDGSAQDDAPTSQQMIVGRWHHMVGTYDGSTIKIYLDGALVGSRGSITGTIHTVTTANAFAVGRLGALSSDYFDGKVDEVKVFNYAATASQVRTIYNQGSAVRFGPITGTP